MEICRLVELVVARTLRNLRVLAGTYRGGDVAESTIRQPLPTLGRRPKARREHGLRAIEAAGGEAWFKREIAPKLDAFSPKDIAAALRALADL
jgi:hypothetical protein